MLCHVGYLSKAQCYEQQRVSVRNHCPVRCFVCMLARSTPSGGDATTTRLCAWQCGCVGYENTSSLMALHMKRAIKAPGVCIVAHDREALSHYPLVGPCHVRALSLRGKCCVARPTPWPIFWGVPLYFTGRDIPISCGCDAPAQRGMLLCLSCHKCMPSPSTS